VGAAVSGLGRLLFEALFWTFHPFSPVAIGLDAGWGPGHRYGHAGLRSREPRVPFYERVNRFVFGPPRPPEDPHARTRKLLVEVRRLRGRVGPEDVMRLTGLDREAAERVLLRMVVDHEGDIQVTEQGAIIYAFPSLRPTAGERADGPAPAPIWNERVQAPPLTGNQAGTNVLLGALNGFNLAFSGFAIANGLTVERLQLIVEHARHQLPVPLPPVDGTPLLLGWVPFLFSLGLFALPAVRALRRRREVARAGAENGRRALLRLIAGGEPRAEVTAPEATRAWAAGAAGSARGDVVERAARQLGGEVDVREDGAVVYRFDSAARERAALAEARAAAAPDEAQPGRVVFTSE
jgi:hypothetical protein